MIPRLQMSTFRPYSLRVTTSGAIQYGVPTIVVRLLCDSLICAQKPKSVSLMLPSRESRTLSDLMSRWITFFECKNCRPCKVCRVSDHIIWNFDKRDSPLDKLQQSGLHS